MKRHEAGFLNNEPDAPQQEQMALEACEVALFSGLRQQLKAGAFVGAQLSRLRDNQLFRAAGCKTFEVYCRKFLQMTRDQVGRYLDLHEVVETIRVAELALPATETQAVMLSKIPQERLVGCWRTLLTLCAREQVALSDRVVRRAVQIASASPKVQSGQRRGVEVTFLDLES